MEIELAALLVELPRATRESGHPVVWHFLSVLAATFAPNVEIGVRLYARATFLEPLVLVGRMIDNQVHYDSHAECMRFFKHLFEVVERAVFRIDILIVGNVVTVIGLGRNVKRREPNRVRTETFDILEF